MWCEIHKELIKSKNWKKKQNLSKEEQNDRGTHVLYKCLSNIYQLPIYLSI